MTQKKTKQIKKTKTKNTKKSIKKDNNMSLLSIVAIAIYFMIPFILSGFKLPLIINIIVYLGFAAWLIYIYRDTFKHDFKDIKNHFGKYIGKIILYVFGIFILMGLTNFIVFAIFKVTDASNENYLREILKHSPLMLYTLTCIYYPIVEGIIFRKAVNEIIDKKWPFILFSSLFYYIFNIIYSDLTIDNMLGSLFYFVSMLVISNLYYKTKNFTVSVIVMSVFNTLIFLIPHIVKLISSLA